MSSILGEKELLLDGESISKSVGVFEGYIRPCLVELIATTIFVCLSCMVVQDPLGANIPLPSAVAVALGHGMLATALITAFGNVSGGHFNPVITVAMAVCRETSPGLAAGYIICQIVGSIIGGFLCLSILPTDTYTAIAGGAHILTAVDPGTGILCEMILTATVVFTCLHAFINNEKPKNHQIGAMAVGMAITGCLLAGLQSTGGSMNPARSLGPAVALSTISLDAWTHHYVYWIGPLLGCFIATLLFKLCTGEHVKKPCRPCCNVCCKRKDVVE